MRIIFLANVDWFFESHFVELARRAKARGWDVALAAQFGEARDRLTAQGIEPIELPTRRGQLSPAGLAAAAVQVSREATRSPRTILHGFGLFGMLVGAATRLRGPEPMAKVYTITGRGYAAVAPSLGARAIRLGLRHFCSHVADGPGVRWLAENTYDLAACGLERAVREGRTAVLGGAGIDPGSLACAPMPATPPLKVALVARMIWSKGIDTAVAAVELARARGVDLTLTLAGPVDLDNPRTLTADTLRSFEKTGAVRWLGRVSDINALWSEHHISLLPSRGGEGLPKSLIEAAACGRPIVTTGVPGCREFAEATGGWWVAPDDPEALADQLGRIAGRGDLAELGQRARAVALRDYSHDHNWQIVEAVYRKFYDPS